MTQKEWERIRNEVAAAVAEALGMEDDLIVSEVKTAESMAEAVARLESIGNDIDTALDVVHTFKSKKGPKDWTPRGRR